MTWKYEAEHGYLLAKCPKCTGRMPIGRSLDGNPYRFCPYCGQGLRQGRFKRAREIVYGEEKRL